MSQAEDKDLEYKYSNTAWRESLPAPLTAVEQAEAVRIAKENDERNKELSDKIGKARKEYGDMYYEDSATWRALNFDDKFKALLGRLEKKGVTFSEPEKIILRTTLRNSTVKTRTLSPDYVDDPSKPDPLKGSPNSFKKE